MFDKTLKFKTIGNKKSRRYYKSHRPYWDEELLNKWIIMREREQLYIKYRGRYKFIKKNYYLNSKEHQYAFNKILTNKELITESGLCHLMK